MTQLDLFQKRKRQTNSERSAAMLGVLLSNRGWMTRRQLQAHGFTDRQCRKARQHCVAHGRAQIIFGQRGFKAAAFATDEEKNECRNTLKSQSDELLQQIIYLDNQIHGRTE